MIKSFLYTLGTNLANRRAETLAIIIILILAILIAWAAFSAILGSGFVGLLLGPAAAIYGSLHIPKLAWFWGKPEPESRNSVNSKNIDNSLGDEIPEQFRDNSLEGYPLEAQPEASSPEDKKLHSSNTEDNTLTKPSLIPGCEVPRKTPQGTRLISISDDKAVMKVKSVIHFWNWFLPSLFVVLAIFIGFPLGGVLGFASYEPVGYSPWEFPLSNMTWGAILGFLTFLGLALWSYFSNRPWVKIIVNADTILYGDKKFDRRYFGGMRAGYKSKEAQLKTGFIAPSMGVQRIRLSYGPWGEDLKYLVNAYHAAEIVIWMNDIIDSVGKQTTPKYDPYAGQKLELL